MWCLPRTKKLGTNSAKYFRTLRIMGRLRIQRLVGTATLAILLTMTASQAGHAYEGEDSSKVLITNQPKQNAGQTAEGKNATSRVAVDDETATWKTYRNEGYGFELKYPPDLLISERVSGENSRLPADSRVCNAGVGVLPWPVKRCKYQCRHLR